MAYMMVICRVDGQVYHVSKRDVLELKENSQITLDKSRIPLVYQNLYKTFDFIYLIVYDVSMDFVLVSVMMLIFAE